MAIVLRNGTFLTLSPAHVERADVRIVDGKVVARARTLRKDRDEEAIDLSGDYVMPGMVNAHTHLYSALARGMKGPAKSPQNFLGILKSIWWRLDEALDQESIYYSALVGGIEAAKYGTTTVVDHHASPSHIRGSLDIIKKGLATVGIRGILCYETTDRGGPQRRDHGLEENERFITENTNNPRFRGTMGAHASFTLNDDTARALGDLSLMYYCGVHIHVAEDEADGSDSVKHRGIDIVRRLHRSGILSHKSILAHGVHLSQGQLSAIDKSGSWLVHNPRSNMNNAVGYAPLKWFGGRSALGTDGFPSDMFEESKIGFFRNQESRHKSPLARLPDMLRSGQNLASQFFGNSFGTLTVGSPADLIVLDYAAPTPVTAHNLDGHFLFGMNSGMVKHVMIDGQWVVFNGQLVGMDEERIMREASGVAQRLWKRMEKR